MLNLPAVLLPQVYADRLAASGKDSGLLDIRFDEAEQLAVVDGLREGRAGTRRAGLSEVPRSHHLAYASSEADSALWFRVDPVLHIGGMEAARRGGAISIKTFREHIPSGDWIVPGRGGFTLAVTVGRVEEIDEASFAAWRIHAEHDVVEAVPLDLAAEAPDPFESLKGVWPVGELVDRRFLLVGAGSIGGAAADALARYAVRRLVVVDPDRLSSRNLARHLLGADQLGRYKVNGLADNLRQRSPQIEVKPLALDVIYDADIVRALLEEIDCVVVTSDGVESRRAANHLARRAGKPTVFACVLADGAFGEVLRVRPPRTGCLLCARAELMANGAMNPEPTLDRGYGTGTRHLPMTAVGGDLALVGQLAAKVAVATMLESLGYLEQRLPGDHAVLALQPKPDMSPPFDIDRACELTWRELPEPRSGCRTCGV